MSERSKSLKRHRTRACAAAATAWLVALGAAPAESQTAIRSDPVRTVDPRLAAPTRSTPGACADAAPPVAMLRATTEVGPGSTGSGSDPRPPDEPPSRRSRQYAALLHEGAADLVVARRLSETAFEQRHAQLAAEGYSLQDFEVVDEGSAACFTGIWHVGGSRQRLALGLALDALVQTDAQSTAAGRPPADVETYVLAGRRLFAGLWRDDAHGNLLIADVDHTRIETTVGGVRRLVDLESWQHEGERRYLAIHKPSAAPARLFFGQTFTAFGDEVERQVAAGFQPTELEIEEKNGEPRYTTAWERAAGGFWLFVGLAEPLQDCRLVSLGVESPALRPFDDEHCRSLAGSVPTQPGVPTGAVDGSRKEAVGVRSGGKGSAAAAAKLRAAVTLGLDAVPIGTPALHLVDFVVTRRELVDPLTPPGSSPTHRGVIHDSGSSGPPAP
jgi:hypothetical protein